MIGVEQWRAVIGCFNPKCCVKNSVLANKSLLVKGLGMRLIMILLVLRLLLSGDIESNPGPICEKCLLDTCTCKPTIKPKRRAPSKQCPACASCVPCRRVVCDCGYNFTKCAIEQNAIAIRKQKKRENKAMLRTIQSPQQAQRDKEFNQKSMTVCRLFETLEQASQRKKNDRDATASFRANETPEQASQRKKNDRDATASFRANETPEQASQRKKNDKDATASLRANETPEQASQRKKNDRDATAFFRANETPEQASQRKKNDRDATASFRANETPEQASQRKQQNKSTMMISRVVQSPQATARQNLSAKFRMASLRASEDVQSSIRRKTQSRLCMERSRHKVLLIDEAMLVFHAKIKEGPDYVCTVCHRMMYRSGVRVYSRSNYCKGDQHVLESIFAIEYVCSDGSQWICHACNQQLKRGSMPVQAKANGLALPNVPTELCNFKPLELRLICLRVPFMKLVALPTGKQRCIHGPAVNVPSKLDSICNLLPRLPSQTELVPLKFKRKLCFKGHYMYDNVCPDKIIKALSWLKQNNCLYSDVTINPDWFDQSADNNADLFAGLIGQTEKSVHNVMQTVITEYDEHYNVLVALANEHKLSIHDVVGDGNCLFSSICYQLKIGASVDSALLRSLTVCYLRQNPCINGVHQGEFLSNDIIAGNSSAVLSAEEKWESYLQQLQDGAWGDHIAIQAISNLLNIQVNILSTISRSLVMVSPTNGSCLYTVNIGQIMEQHYVGLDVCDMLCNDLCDSNQTSVNSIEPGLDDDAIEEGDEYSRQITGGPQACSMLTIENPEAEGQEYSVAPAESHKPLNIMTDEKFELMCNPDKFPFGTGAFHSPRPTKITYRKYFQQRLLDVDGRFSRDLDYLFAAQYIVESKQVYDDATNYIWRQRPSSQLTAGQAKKRNVIVENMRKDRAYAFLKNVRGSPPYYQHTFYELLAMIRQLGTPTWFFTLSAADMKWPEVIQTIARQYGKIYTDEDVANMCFEERSKWLRQNPVTAARHFQYRLDTFFQEFLKSTAHPLGEIVDEAIRIEFQNRGSPHAHCVLWVKNTPKFGVDPDQVVCNFIDKYIACSIPNEECKLKELVLMVQQHKHATYCKRNGQCRFSFPHPPSSSTLISHEGDNDEDIKKASKHLLKVKKLLIEGDINISLNDLLTRASLSDVEYEKAVATTARGNKIILKRDPCECNINNYNPSVLLAWQANMDIQYVMDAYACVMYVASYIMKHEKSMGELLKNVSNEVRTEELTTQLRRIGTAFLTHREVSAQEAVYRLLSMPMKRLSRSVVFIDTTVKEQRIVMLKNYAALSRLKEDDTGVFNKSLIDRYQHRPHTIHAMCLAEFAATYSVDYRGGDNDEDECDALPNNSNCDSSALSSKIILTGGFGKMTKRSRHAVIRFRCYSKDVEPNNWYRAKLMLYYPWYKEDTDLLGGFSTYEEHYNNVKPTVLANENVFTVSDVGDTQVDMDSRPEHVWDQLAPSTQEGQHRACVEGDQPLTEMTDEDLAHNSRLLDPTSASSVHVRYERAANANEICPDEYRRLMRQLNDKQREIVMFHRSWCKSAVIALRNNQPVKPYRVFMSGPGGVGKSHVIKLIHSDTLKLLRLSGCIEPGEVTVLLTAPTGVAAFNISGMTLHSAFLLNLGRFGYQPLNSEKLNTLRMKLSNLLRVVIDEVSMVGSNMLLEIHKRLQQIKGVSADHMFGGVSILAVGDLYQLPPVGQPAVFNTVTDAYAKLYASGSLWQEEFCMIELSEVMPPKRRQ